MHPLLQLKVMKPDFAHYGSEAAHKLLSDNRDLYIDQSRRTTTSRAAEFSPSSPAADTPRCMVAGGLELIPESSCD